MRIFGEDLNLILNRLKENEQAKILGEKDYGPLVFYADGKMRIEKYLENFRWILNREIYLFSTDFFNKLA